nr:hypothetical protein CFP56_50749 [Quercus suber]
MEGDELMAVNAEIDDVSFVVIGVHNTSLIDNAYSKMAGHVLVSKVDNEYLGRTGSAIPTASLPGTEVSVEEIRTAGSFSDHYPPSIHAALVSPPEPDPNVQDIVYQGGYGGEYGGTGTTTDFQRQILDEVVIQELLIDHVGHGCCWGSHPARTWKIHTVEDCNVYNHGQKFPILKPSRNAQDVMDGEILSVLHAMQTKNLDFIRKIRWLNALLVMEEV